MSSIMKVFLLLAVVVCISRGQLVESGSCLCRGVRGSIRSRSEINIEIHPASIFCNKVEIVVTHKNGDRYCLNPDLRAVKKFIAKVKSKQMRSTSGPTELSSTPANTITARM